MSINLVTAGCDHLEYWAMTAFSARVSRQVQVCVKSGATREDADAVEAAIALAEKSAETATAVSSPRVESVCVAVTRVVDRFWEMKEEAQRDPTKGDDRRFEAVSLAATAAVYAALSADEQVLDWTMEPSEFVGLERAHDTYVHGVLTDVSPLIETALQRRPFAYDFCQCAERAASHCTFTAMNGKGFFDWLAVSEAIRDDYAKLLAHYSVGSRKAMGTTKPVPPSFWEPVPERKPPRRSLFQRLKSALW